MVKILSIFLATLAAISPVAQAGNCVPGLKYCGSTLQRYDIENVNALCRDSDPSSMATLTFVFKLFKRGRSSSVT
ncbi:hypothetical protein E4U32_007460 [Claviceps aff. humidiphila group G2b]|nr:hypothetical protein E4U32_007460 [Claviceps aff. humidiphila group G2b]